MRNLWKEVQMMENKFDVIVIGAGPSGLSAAMFLAEGELKTLVIGHGVTQMKSAWIENYFGIEEGFHGSDLNEIGRRQVEKLGVQVVDGKVTDIKKGETFTVVTEAGEFEADELILASGQGPNIGTPELARVEMVENDEPFSKAKIKIDERHRTSVPGIWATGIATGIGSQAVIAAGHGAQTALNVISARLGERKVIHRTPAKK
jgi:thioredoxin reductase (NADPH)